MDKITTEIRELEEKGDTDELSSYLIDLAKNGNNPSTYEDEFKKHLVSSDWCLRKAAVFCLLFALKIDNPEYRENAIKFIGDKNEDDEVRRWAAAGLAQTYQKTRDKELLKPLIEIIDDPSDDEDIKEGLLSSALLIYGITSREQLFRTDAVLPSLDQLQQTFGEELMEIRELIK